MRKRRNRITEEEGHIIERFYGEESYKDIGMRIGRTASQVMAWRKANLASKFSPGTSQFSRKHVQTTCNENFFAENSKESQYWAGFIAADGCILDHTGKTKGLKIELSIRDLEHLRLFKQHVGWNGMVRTYSYKGYKACSLEIRSDTLCRDLETMYNITPRKTYTYVPPLMSKSCFCNFLRGYIDGDGSISKLQNGRVWTAGMNITSNTVMCEWVRDETKRLLGIQFSDKCVAQKIGGSEGISVLQVSGKASRELLCCIFDEELCLIRKWWFSKDFCENYTDPRRLFSEEDIDDILLALLSGYPQEYIARLYGVHQVTISGVKSGKVKAGYSGEIYNQTYLRVMEGIESVTNMEEEN